MGQVFQNIITNGIQAMTEGGSVRISARLVQSSTFKVQGYNEKNIELEALNSEPDPDFIEIRTADSGEGISPENMGKLFQPLFTTKAKGIGLGLVLCKNLVEANGGRIKVESRLGEGSTFSVILPVAGNEG
jgi:signal transduction histidine kinase